MGKDIHENIPAGLQLFHGPTQFKLNSHWSTMDQVHREHTKEFHGPIHITRHITATPAVFSTTSPTCQRLATGGATTSARQSSTGFARTRATTHCTRNGEHQVAHLASTHPWVDIPWTGCPCNGGVSSLKLWLYSGARGENLKGEQIPN